MLMVFFSSRISPFTSTVILRDKSPLATAVVTSAMLRTCAGEVGRHGVDVVGQSFQVPATPGTTAWPPSLPSVPTSRATRVTSEAKRAQLIDHRVDGFLELRDFAAHIDGDLARQVAVGDGDGDFGDVADLAGQVVGHRVDGVGKILPGAGDALDLGLAAELAFGADFARHARDFRCEDRELADHRVDELGRAQEFALQRLAVHLQAPSFASDPPWRRRRWCA